MASLDHIIVLMMENNSFDRMLGSLFVERSGGGGIKGTANNHWNDDQSASAKPPTRHLLQPTKTRVVQPDPNHEHLHVMDQIRGPCKGFVTDFATVYPASDWLQRQEIMGYYPDGDLPNLHKLAKEYTVCDRWFSSMPGPTWPNRVFAHTGTSLGYTTNSVANNWNQTTLYDRFDSNSISWKIYYGDGDVSQTVVLRHAPWVDPMRYFYRDVQGPENKFPQFCFIEPHYGTLPWNRQNQNDQHPVSDVFRGEVLIREVYNAIRANQALWQRSLLVITYDEHGGFYDHVDPPSAVPPDNRTDQTKFDFRRLGVRVPTILVSPWLDQGIITDTFDHTSVLKFVSEKWGLGNFLGDRVASPSTASFVKYLRKSPRQTFNLLPKTNIPTLLAPQVGAEMTDHQRSLIELGHHLASRIDEPTVRDHLMVRAVVPTQEAEAQLAVEQFRAFLVDTAKRPVSQLPRAGKKSVQRKAAGKRLRKAKRSK
jgi:phospholipase C